MLSLNKYQKLKERVKVSKYKTFGGFVLETVALTLFLKTL
jgi:hypothetical protein